MLPDELTGNLDIKRGQGMAKLLRQKALDMNKGVVSISHDHRIREVAHRVFWLEDGSLYRVLPFSAARPSPRAAPREMEAQRGGK